MYKKPQENMKHKVKDVNTCISGILSLHTTHVMA